MLGDARSPSLDRGREAPDDATRGSTNWNIASRNFAVLLVQHLEASLQDLGLLFKGDLPVFGFVSLLCDFIAAFDTQPRHTHRTTSARSPDYRSLVDLALVHRAANEAYLESSEGLKLKETIKRWATTMKYRLASTGPVEQHLIFTARAHLEFALWCLFRSIDHNKTGLLNWDDFLGYLFESTMRGRSAAAVDDTRLYLFVYRADSSVFHRVQSLHHLPDRKSYLVHGKDKEKGPGVKIVDERTLQVEAEYTTDEAHGALVTYEVLLKEEIIILATADTNVRAYNMKTHQARVQKKCGVTITKLSWDDKGSRLYVGFRTGELEVWNLCLERILLLGRGKEAPEPVVVMAIRPHRDAITDMVFIPNDGHVVTSSLDATIKCLSMETLQLQKTLVGHKRGIRRLAYSHQYNLLLSCGHEYHPLAWVINVANSKPFRFRDAKPHTAPVVGIVLIVSAPQCVTLDETGTVKIWDLRTLHCIQTILCEPSASREELQVLRWKTVVYHKGNKQIIAAANRRAYIFQFNQQGRCTDAAAAVDFAISAGFYCKQIGSYVTVSRKDIRVWDTRTGAILQEFKDIVPEDIRCIAVDEDGTKGYLGCLDGTFAVLSFATGTVVTKLRLPAQCEVTSVTVIPATPYVLCVTVDGEATVVTDYEGILDNTTMLISGFRPARIDAKVVCVYEEYNVFCVGEGLNVVSVWQLEPKVSALVSAWSRLAECASSPMTSEITSVCPLRPLPFFAAADTSGGVHVWTLSAPDVARPYVCISQWVNNHSKQGSRYTPIVTAMAYYAPSYLLYVADDVGFINVYSLKESIESAVVAPAPAFAAPQIGKLSLTVTVTPRVSCSGLGHAGWKKADTKPARLVRTWKAHKECIPSLQLLERPMCLMTAGEDCMVSFWSLWGEQVAHLRKSDAKHYTLHYPVTSGESEPYIDIPYSCASDTDRRASHRSRTSSRRLTLSVNAIGGPARPATPPRPRKRVSLKDLLQAPPPCDDAEKPVTVSPPAKPAPAPAAGAYDLAELTAKYTVFYRSAKEIVRSLHQATLSSEAAAAAAVPAIPAAADSPDVAGLSLAPPAAEGTPATNRALPAPKASVCLEPDGAKARLHAQGRPCEAEGSLSEHRQQQLQQQQRACAQQPGGEEARPAPQPLPQPQLLDSGKPGVEARPRQRQEPCQAAEACPTPQPQTTTDTLVQPALETTDAEKPRSRQQRRACMASKVQQHDTARGDTSPTSATGSLGRSFGTTTGGDKEKPVMACPLAFRNTCGDRGRTPADELLAEQVARAEKAKNEKRSLTGLFGVRVDASAQKLLVQQLNERASAAIGGKWGDNYNLFRESAQTVHRGSFDARKENTRFDDVPKSYIAMDSDFSLSGATLTAVDPVVAPPSPRGGRETPPTVVSPVPTRHDDLSSVLSTRKLDNHRRGGGGGSQLAAPSRGAWKPAQRKRSTLPQLPGLRKLPLRPKPVAAAEDAASPPLVPEGQASGLVLRSLATKPGYSRNWLFT
ncbi:Lissencephaly-1-like protein [Diplonema papillatum]|nr:Lissencephaly-1-like protein [Diplonema papillatum]